MECSLIYFQLTVQSFTFHKILGKCPFATYKVFFNFITRICESRAGLRGEASDSFYCCFMQEVS